MGAFFVVLAALAPSGDTNRLQLDAALQLDMSSTNNAVVYSSGGWLGLDARMALTIFGRRVKDDDAAPSLQPFLQRVPLYSLQVAGGGASLRSSPLPGLTDTTREGFVTATASASGYLRGLYLGGGLELRDNIVHVGAAQLQDSNDLLVTPWLVLGGRWQDVLFFAGWSVTPTRGPNGLETVYFWGHAWLGAETVIRRFIDLTLRVDVLKGGAVADAGVDVWLRRRFAVSAGLQGGRGAFADSQPVWDRAGGRAALSYWLNARVGLTVTYTFFWQRVADGGVLLNGEIYSVQHLLAFNVSWRPLVHAAMPSPDDDGEPMK